MLVGSFFGDSPIRTIPLTHDKFALVDDCNYKWLTQWRWSATKWRNIWYAVRTVTDENGKRHKILMHREILKSPLGMQIDHKNRDGLHNYNDNLRVATQSQNLANQRKRQGVRTTSKYKGVCRDKFTKKWHADIRVNRKRIYLGLFDIEEDAACAYDAAAVQYYGEFAYVNFPGEKMSERFGIISDGSLSAFVAATVFISAFKEKFPDCVFDLGAQDFILNAARKWGIFSNFMGSGDLYTRATDYSVVVSGRRAWNTFGLYPNCWFVPDTDAAGLPSSQPLYRSNLDFIRDMGFSADVKPFWPVDEARKNFIREALVSHKRPVIGFHNSKSRQYWYRRKWPNKSFAKLKWQLPITTIQLGSTDDWNREKISHAVTVDTEGDLGELAAWIANCDVFVGADTGVTAMAQAIGVPTVLLSGPTGEMNLINAKMLVSNVCEYRPCLSRYGFSYGSTRILDCKGTDRTPCMDAISVERVYDAVIELLGEKANLIARH